MPLGIFRMFNVGESMISEPLFKRLSYIILALMLIILLLVLFRVVPQSWYWPMFAIVLVLFLIRSTLRLVLARQTRLDEKKREEEGRGTPTGGAE
jgi:hypothetical protein